MQAKLQAWLPTLISKKLGAFISSFAVVLRLGGVTPNVKAIALAIIAAAYKFAVAYTEAHLPAA